MGEKPRGNYPPSSGLNAENAAEVIADRKETISKLSAASTPEEIQAALDILFKSQVTELNGAKLGEQRLLDVKNYLIDSATRDLKKWGVEE